MKALQQEKNVEFYEAPKIEIIDIKIEQGILNNSGTGTGDTPDFGGEDL